MNRASSHVENVFKIRVRPERGQTTIEFALVVIFLFVLVLSIVEMTFFVSTYNVLADSAKEGVRYAIVHGKNNSQPSGPTCPCADIDGPPAPPGTIPGYGSGYGVVKTFAQYSLHDVTGTKLTVTVTYGPADTVAVTPLNKTPNRVQVVVAYPYKPFFGLGWPTVTVNAAAEGRIMN
jgi:Flp pilus assembly protein TadG